MPRNVTLRTGLPYVDGDYTVYTAEEAGHTVAALAEALAMTPDPEWPPACLARFQAMQAAARSVMTDLDSDYSRASSLRDQIAYGDPGEGWATDVSVSPEIAPALQAFDAYGFPASSVLITRHQHEWVRRALNEAAALRQGCGSFNVGAGLAILGGMALFAGVVAFFGRRPT